MGNNVFTQERFAINMMKMMGRRTKRIQKAIMKKHALSGNEFWKRVYALYSDVDADSKMDISIEEVQDLSEFINLIERYL